VEGERIFRNRKAAQALRDDRLTELNEVERVCGPWRFSKNTSRLGRASTNVTRAQRDVRWSEAVAVGSLAFVEKVKGELGARAIHREFDPVDGGYVLREPTGFYARRFTGDNETLSSENTLLWEESDERANT